jgi:RNA polymerase sigma factor (sigma-70 family)
LQAEWRGGKSALSTHPHAPHSPEQIVEELSRRHRRIAVCAANDVLRDWTQAEDAAQLGFLVILNRLRAGDAEFLRDRPEATVRRNARWAAMNMRTSRLRREAAEDRSGRQELDDAEAPWVASEARETCEAILRELPEHYRQAIALRFFGDLPDAAAASRLDVTLRAYRRRLDRALDRAHSVAVGIGLGGAAIVAGAVTGIRAALRDAGRRAMDMGLAWGTPLASTTALVVISATPGVAVALHAAPAAPPADVVGTVAESAPGAAQGGRVIAAAPASTAAPHATVVRVAAQIPGRTAAEETPDDSDIYNAAASPSTNRGGALVAVGWGHTCACSVMFESRDGWHTWRAAPGPSADTFLAQVALPPAYPADPRIFIGWPTVGPALDMVSPGFGRAFVSIPAAGYVTLPPSFERDGGFYVTTTNGMLHLALSGVALSADLGRPAVFLPPVDGSVAAGAPTAGDDAAYALAASTSDLATAGGASIAAAAAASGHPVLYRCDDGGRCQSLSAPAIDSAGGVAVSREFAGDHAIAVTWGPRVLLSTDAGKSFVPIPDADGSVIQMQISSAQGRIAVWAVVGSNGREIIQRWEGGARWSTITPPQIRSGDAHSLRLVMLSTDRAFVAGADIGVRCTADGGLSWSEACPG